MYLVIRSVQYEGDYPLCIVKTLDDGFDAIAYYVDHFPNGKPKPNVLRSEDLVPEGLGFYDFDVRAWYGIVEVPVW